MQEYNDYNRCPICKLILKTQAFSNINTYKINCSRCGKFEISETALTMFFKSVLSDKILSVSYWIRHHQNNEYVWIDSDTLRSLLVPFIPPKPREQAYNFIQYVCNTYPLPNQNVIINFDEIVSIIGASDVEGVIYILKYLIEFEKFFSQGNFFVHNRGYQGIISFKGWDTFFAMQNSNKESRLAFMAMKFGDEQLNNIYENIIKRIVLESGFDIRRLDEERRAGLIDDKLRVEIRRSKFIIADLTHDNNGAYWEAGFAEGLGIPVIYICEESKFCDRNKPTHFDTNHHLTVQWKDDEDGLKKFANELKATIRATFPTESKQTD